MRVIGGEYPGFRSRLLWVDVLPGRASSTPIIFRLPCETHTWAYRVRFPRSRAIILFWPTKENA